MEADRYEVGIMLDDKVAREPFRLASVAEAFQVCQGTPRTPCRPYVYDRQERRFLMAAGNDYR